MPSHQYDTPAASSRERLLEAAKRLFARHGYEQTATSTIAREAGTSESQLMRYFGGKVGLLDALFEDAWAHLNARVARAVKRSPTSRQRLLDAVQAIVGALARDQDLAILLMFEGRRRRGDEPRIRVARGSTQHAETIRACIQQGQATGEIDASLDANALTSALLGAAEAMIRDRLLSKAGARRSFAEREIRRTLDALLHGAAPKSKR
jgi:AcrR family transcriptional regulator